jgi:trehalose 6-phosphate phosphatase
VERELSAGPVVYRYLADDGLPGSEGGFLLCTSWLIRCLILLGRVDDARQRFERMLELAGPTGLMSEEYGAHTRRALGNVPQAFSHIGVIEAALDLARALAGRDAGSG